MPRTGLLGNASVDPATNTAAVAPLETSGAINVSDSLFWGFDREIDALFVAPTESAGKDSEFPDSNRVELLGERGLLDNGQLPIPAKAVEQGEYSDPEFAGNLRQQRPFYFVNNENRPSVVYFVPANHRLVER